MTGSFFFGGNAADDVGNLIHPRNVLVGRNAVENRVAFKQIRLDKNDPGMSFCHQLVDKASVLLFDRFDR